MRRAIETAPRDGKFVILEDDVSGRFELAQWSAEARGWVRENGEPSKIAPTHWQTTDLPQEGDEVILQDKSTPQKETGLTAPPPSRGPRSFVFPSGLAARARAAELTRKVADADLSLSSDLGVRAAQGKSERGARHWFAVSSIVAVMVGAVLIGWYFHAELAAYVTRYSGEQDNARAGTGGVAVVGRADAPANEQMAKLSQAAETATAELRQSLQKERDRAEALAGELATARQDLETQLALSSKAGNEAVQVKKAAESATAELRQSLQKERDRAEALMSELAKAKRDRETQLARSSKAADEAPQVKKAAENAMAELRQDRAAAPAREPTQPTVGARIEVERASNSQTAQVTQAAEAAATVQPAAVEAQGSPEAARLLARASALISQGNIGAARIVLERAVETGSAQASFMLAETYDPLVLSTWKTYGTRGDVTKARELYAKALAGGIQEAKDRSVALH